MTHVFFEEDSRKELIDFISADGRKRVSNQRESIKYGRSPMSEK